MSGTVARVVQFVRKEVPRPTKEQQEADRQDALANAPEGHCPKCGGWPILVGTKYAENLPRACVKCGHRYEHQPTG